MSDSPFARFPTNSPPHSQTLEKSITVIDILTSSDSMLVTWVWNFGFFSILVQTRHGIVSGYVNLPVLLLCLLLGRWLISPSSPSPAPSLTALPLHPVNSLLFPRVRQHGHHLFRRRVLGHLLVLPCPQGGVFSHLELPREHLLMWRASLGDERPLHNS